MKIVYISSLSGNPSHGPTYSVPAQIESQSKLDDVFWYNFSSRFPLKAERNYICHTSEDYTAKSVLDFPESFQRPELVIFQGFYFQCYLKIAQDLKKRNIPYLIIPRSSLTKEGQQKKPMKKRLANQLFFNSFARDALAIQYLTEEEYRASGDSWNIKAIVIPNGIHQKAVTKDWDAANGSLKGVFIGRLDIYQKGLDLLIEACAAVKKEMMEHNCSIDIYGPDDNGSKNVIQELIVKHGLEDCIQLHEGIFGKEKEDVLLNSDFFLLTSRFEGHPMGLIEAFSYGVPCVITPGANMEEEVERTNAGLTAQSSVESIANALKRLMEQKKHLPRMSENARTLSDAYNWNSLAEKSAESFENLTAKAVFWD
ncbi:glycosyltransferase [Sporosarcina aquimarina]|uniref:Glycosyltransferase n=1 Tax=Sporosarcina aquimarina TaxID=114975 RepID=A0ABU4G131_9BACL|nr:glycosyltransferase [Sporosarcina aquimarina]MDW0110674.1 glycosyltransferase [Sporosarcina aquimarina]